MPIPTAFVARVRALRDTDAADVVVVPNVAPVARPVEVSFIGDWQDAHVDPTHPRAAVFVELLRLLAALNRPAFIRITDQGSIDDVRATIEGRVVRLAGEADGSLLVDVDTSAKRLVLLPSADSRRMAQLLVQSRDENTVVVIVTDGDGSVIADVREPPQLPGTPGPARAAPDLTRLDGKPVTRVSAARARAVFKALFQTNCRQPIEVASTCIPFDFPDDGCFARAHAMCEMIVCERLTPGKLWLFGNLTVRTANHPNCQVPWAFHVVPFLRQPVGGKWKVWDLEPALFGKPVTLRELARAVGAKDIALRQTPPSVFLDTPDNERRPERPGVDGGSRESVDLLRLYRLDLRERQPPPPFHCSEPTVRRVMTA